MYAKPNQPADEKNITAIGMVLDESGSMYSIKSDTLGGFNTFIDEQQKEEGSAYFTFTKFNTSSTQVLDFVDVQAVPQLTDENYTPNGGTALYDAIVDTIVVMDKRIKETPLNLRPNKFLVAILTDGQENSSQRANKDKVKSLIEEKTKEGWQFLYLSADLNAMADGASIGINLANVAQFTPGNTKAVYSVTSSKAGRIRGMSASAAAQFGAVSYNASERKSLTEDEKK